VTKGAARIGVVDTADSRPEATPVRAISVHWFRRLPDQ
jgi:hypothetical protein